MQLAGETALDQNPRFCETVPFMQTEVTYTWQATIYLSGPLAVAEQVCREYCYSHGLCVTVSPTKFIYTGGEEVGVQVGLLQYPRFPKDVSELEQTTRELAETLRKAMVQHSVLIVFPHYTTWMTEREENAT